LVTDKEFLKRILVPVDGSASSIVAEEVAARVAKKAGATVTILHVVPRLGFYGELNAIYDLPKNVADDIIGGMEQHGAKIIDAAQTLFNQESVPVETEMLKDNDPAETILEHSKDGFDLIAIGVHGENEKDPYTLGSITKKVIMHTRTPTLITKEVSSLSSMLVCVDGSDRSIKALEYAVKLAEKTGSNIAMLNVQEHRLHRASPKVAQELSERIFSKALDAVGKGKRKIEKKLEIGVPSDKIIETAEKGKHDLIVLGSRGLNPVKRFLLGSVSDDVSQKAKCSVLIVP
jgi:nucleotide-binding universal stress UspA family protein